MKQDCLTLLDTIEAKVSDLQNYLASKDKDQLNLIPAEGKWSPIMTVHHLMLAEGGSLAYCKKKLSFNPELDEATTEQIQMETKVPYMLRSPKYKAVAPPGIGTESLDNKMTFDNAFKQWKALRSQTRAFIEQQPDEHFSKALYKHPLAGKMRLIGMIMFFEAHIDSHTAQIKENFKVLASA